MKTVSDTLHLERRSGTYYYRRRVPDFAVKKLGARMLKYSLKTHDKKQARKLREVEDLKWSAHFEAIEKGDPISETGAEPGRSLSAAAAANLVHEYVVRTDRTAQRRHATDRPETLSEKNEMAMDAEIALDTLLDPADPRGEEQVAIAAEQLETEAAARIEGKGFADEQFADLVQRGLVELARRKLARLQDDYQRPFFDDMFNPAKPKSVTFGEVAQQYLAKNAEEAVINRISQKRTDKVAANAALIREIVGDATLVCEVDYDACLRVRSLLSRTPANRTKVYRTLTLDAAIARADRDGKPVLSATTQGQYLETFRQILELAALKRLIPHNPAQSLRPLKRDDISRADKRLPFSIDQIKEFFGSEFYRSCAPNAPSAYTKPDRDWRFWLPLLCLFMGMRPNEACQMLVSDIKKTEAGTWYVEIASTVDDDSNPLTRKTLKSSASRRRIPIHPQLLALGFLALTDSKKPSARLFSSLKPDKYGNLATYALRRFKEKYLKEAMHIEEKQTFYSFRHSFRDALRRIDAQPATLQALGGWHQGSLTSDDYGDKSDPDYQAKFVGQIDFPGLDLSFLRR